MTVLGQFSDARGNFDQGAAGACNRASQMVYKHPWGVKAHTLAKLFLPAFVRYFLDLDMVAHAHNLMD